MAIPTITPLPPAPQRATQPEGTFDDAADLFTAALEVMAPELNASIGAMNATAAQVDADASQVAADKATVAANTETTQDIYEAIAQASLDELEGVSSSAVTIGLGSKSFEASAARLWFVGMAIILRDAASANNYMAGEVTVYDPATGNLTITVYDFGGSGTISDWLIYPTGRRFDARWVEIATLPTTSGTIVTFSSIPQSYLDLMFRFNGVSSNSGGSPSFTANIGGGGEADISGNVSGTQSITGAIYVPSYSEGLGGGWVAAMRTTSPGHIIRGGGWTGSVTSALFSLTSDSFDAGSITLLAR